MSLFGWLFGSTAAPALDGLTPVFEEVGADPTLAPGLARPPGSIAKFASAYYWKFGTGNTDWSLAPFTGGAGGSPLTTKGDLYGFSTLGARVPVGADGKSLAADSSAALGVSYQTRGKQADWSASLVRFFFVDYDAGDDTKLGYIDAAAGSTFTGGQTSAVAIKTLEQLYSILPPLGDNRQFVILQKNRAAGATYLDKDGVTVSNIRNLQLSGYSNYLWRGSSDLSNDATDKLACGFIVATTGPAAGGAFVVDVGATTTSIPIVGGGLVVDGSVQYRLRVLTGARSGQVRTVTANSATAFTLASAITGAPGAGDTVAIERPGVSVGSIQWQGPAAYSGFTIPRLVGVAAVSTTTFTSLFTGINVTMCGIEFPSATNGQTLFATGITNLSLTDTYLDEAGATQRVGMGLRTVNNWSFTSITQIQVAAFGSMNGAISGGLNNVMVGNFGRYSYFKSGITFTSCGGGGAPTSGAQTNGFMFGDSVTGNAQTRLVYGGAVQNFRFFGCGSIALARFNLEGWNGVNVFQLGSGTSVGSSVPFVAMDGITGSVTAASILDLRRAYGTTVVLGTTTANTATSTTGDLILPGTVFATIADFAKVGFVDQNGNKWIGSAGLTSDAAIPVSASGALAPGNTVYLSGVSTVAKTDATAASKSKIAGVMLTTTANGAAGLMAPPQKAYVLVDGSVTAGDLLWLSPTTTGTVTSTVPTGTNQTVRCGRALTTSASAVTATLMPEAECSVVPTRITSGGGSVSAGATVEMFAAVQTVPWTYAVQVTSTPGSNHVIEYANDTGAAGLSTYLQRKTNGTTAVVCTNHTGASIDVLFTLLGWPP